MNKFCLKLLGCCHFDGAPATKFEH